MLVLPDATGDGRHRLTIPVGWATYITNFVFWIGIGHAGTLISAILYLFRVDWRTSVYRVAETMTVFAVMTAALFPLIHLGRVWVFYWLLPYPNQRHLWPNFRSAAGVGCGGGDHLPDGERDLPVHGADPGPGSGARCGDQPAAAAWYRFFALGWQGEHGQWRHYLRAYMALACLATPLVISVHSIVSWDFAASLLPGWHETIFAPYFVAGGHSTRGWRW